MFICVDDVIYIETQFYRSEFCDFINLWKMVKNTIKLWWRFFLHKINKNMQRKPVVKCVVYSWVWCHFQKKLLNFIILQKLTKTPQTFVQGLSSITLTEICHKSRGEVKLRSSLRKLFVLNNLSYYDWKRHLMQNSIFFTVSLVQ